MSVPRFAHIWDLLNKLNTGTSSGKFLRDDGTWQTITGGSFQFPIGAIYLNVTGVNPSSELDYGTWIQRGQGRVLIGFDATDPDYDAVGDVVGSKTHKHDDHPALQHNGTSITDHAIHKHPAGTLVDSTVTGSRKGGTSGAATLTDSHGHTITGNTGNPSGTLTHSVTQPSEHAVQSHSEVNHMPAGFIVYIWERTT